MVHGIRIEEDNTQFVPGVNVVSQVVIGLYGISNSPDAENIDVVRTRQEAVRKYGAGKEDEDDTIYKALLSIYDQVSSQIVVVIKALAVEIEPDDPPAEDPPAEDPPADDPAPQNEELSDDPDENAGFVGVQRFKLALSRVGFEPTILIAPSLTRAGTALSNDLISVASDMKVFTIFDVGGANVAEIRAAVAELTESNRAIAVHPDKGRTPETREGGAATLAGVWARTQAEEGFWVSFSNKVARNFVPSRAIGWSLTDENSEANALNNLGVTTFINDGRGYKAWGNRSLVARTNPYTFIPVRRTADVINRSILESSQFVVDRGINKSYVTAVIELVNNFLRDLKFQGAIIEGRCYADTRNSASNVKQGRVFFRYQFTPNYPAEEVTFTVAISDEGIEEIFTDAGGAP